MRVTPNILYGLLSEKYQLDRYGKGIRSKELSLPVLYEPGMSTKTGGVYVARTGDLPNRPPDGCVIICCGTKPPKVWNTWSCDVMHIVDPHTNIVGIFNVMLGILDQILTWEDTMQRLALSGADIKELVETSIPIFRNTITVSDYDLRILAHCEADPNVPGSPIVMNDRDERVPPRYISATKDFGPTLRRNRVPYVVDEIENLADGIGGISSYCVNIFYGDDYAGTCALKEEVHPFQPFEQELFQMFASYVQSCLSVQSKGIGSQIIPMRSVFEQILQGYPVSMRDLSNALKLIEQSMQKSSLDDFKWCCTVIQNSHRDRGLPDSYLCDTVESILPNTTAFVYDESVVAFSLIDRASHRLSAVCEPLLSYLEDMDFKAGVSRTFRDPFHARTFYRQALNALDMGGELEPERRYSLFGDHVLNYMLQNCCGDFDTKSIVAPELVRLYGCGQCGPEYIRTLRVFLDNDCHITLTAKEMFLHRSTLIKRLEKIREIVNLDSADRRLYLHMCLHLPDIERTLEGDVDEGGIA